MVRRDFSPSREAGAAPDKYGSRKTALPSEMRRLFAGSAPNCAIY
jgi:hypothetical protein